VGIGGQLLDAKALQAGDWSAITAMAQRYVERAAAGPA
jgi:2-keto-3-deoxy-6-phosphogluconate aldolase